jgi:transcription antitermination factor NusG
MNHPWYALRVKSRCEHSVASHLRARCFEPFLPLYKSRRRWSDRFKEIELPIFSGYVFCQFDLSNRLPVVTVPGIVHIVGVGRVPVPIAEAEILAIQTAIRSGLPRQPWPFLEVGKRVRIEHGPLCGVEGILLDFRGQRHLILSVNLLQRSIAVQIDRDEVWPIAHEKQVNGGVVASPVACRVGI